MRESQRATSGGRTTVWEPTFCNVFFLLCFSADNKLICFQSILSPVKGCVVVVFFVFYLFKAPDRGSAVLAVQIHSSQAVIHWIHLHTQTLTVSVKSNWLELRPTDRGKSPRGRRHFAASPRDHWFFTLLLVITDDAGHKSGDHGGPGCPDWPDREWEIGNRDITAGKRDA